MAKRLTDTEIWEQDWFVALPNKYKLLWMYIKDKCDDCGVWRPNKEILQRILSEPLNLNEFLVYVNTDEKQRTIVLKNGRWFLPEYFIFQYGNKFNPASPVHRGFLKRLLNNGVHIKEIPNLECHKLIDADSEQLRQIAYEYPNNTLLIAFGYPTNRVIDKDIEYNKKGGVGENNFQPKRGSLKSKSIRGEKFDENIEYVIFSDGSQQELKDWQKKLIESNDLTPMGIFKSND